MSTGQVPDDWRRIIVGLTPIYYRTTLCVSAVFAVALCRNYLHPLLGWYTPIDVNAHPQIVLPQLGVCVLF